MRRQAIQAGQADDGTLDGIAMTSQFVGEFMQEIQLDEWVNFHGGLVSEHYRKVCLGEGKSRVGDSFLLAKFLGEGTGLLVCPTF